MGSLLSHAKPAGLTTREQKVYKISKKTRKTSSQQGRNNWEGEIIAKEMQSHLCSSRDSSSRDSTPVVVVVVVVVVV